MLNAQPPKTSNRFQTIEYHKGRFIEQEGEEEEEFEDHDQGAYQHSEVLYPLAIRNTELLDPKRVVLYREDCREVPYVMNEGSLSPIRNSMKN